MTQMKFRKIYTKTRRISMVYCKTAKHELAYKTKKIMNNKTYTNDRKYTNNKKSMRIKKVYKCEKNPRM